MKRIQAESFCWCSEQSYTETMTRVYHYKVACICLLTFTIITLCFVSINLSSPQEIVCRELGFSKTALPVTALASFPGSGNTWTRHLIQKTTGILTGSVYNDARLKRSGFPGESVTNGSVVVVKTHTSKPDRIKIFDRVVLILRDPYEAILSFFHFRQTPGHVGQATQEDFDKEWVKWVNAMSKKWKTMNRFWLQTYRGPLHVVKYQNLKSDLKVEMQKICNFLHIAISRNDLECAYSESVGNFKRNKSSADLMALYTPEMQEKINGYREEIYAKMEERESK